MTELYGWILLSGLSMTAIAVMGAVTFFLKEDTRERLLLPLVAFSAGSLLGGAFFHMIPESVATARLAADAATTPFVWVVAGFTSFLALEQLLHWHHCHRQATDERTPLGLLLLLGGGFHNFLGGVAVAGAFLFDTALGISIWFAAAAHEFPQQLGKYGVLLYGGWTRRHALLVNPLTSTSFLAGGLLTLAVSRALDVSIIVPFAAGNFIYIGASDLVPEVNKHHDLGTNLVHFASFAAGAGLLFTIQVLPHG